MIHFCVINVTLLKMLLFAATWSSPEIKKADVVRMVHACKVMRSTDSNKPEIREALWHLAVNAYGKKNLRNKDK